MGCGESKLPRGCESASPAVMLCRGRSELLAEAIARRYALASAHRAYAASLSATGAALCDFLRAAHDAAPPPGGADDVPRDGDDADSHAVSPAAVAPPQSPDDASEEGEEVDGGGHIRFPSSSEDEGDEASGDVGGDAESKSDDEGEEASGDVGGDAESTSDAGADAEPPLPQPVAPAPGPLQPPVQMAPPYEYDPAGYPPPPYSSYGPAYGYGSYGGGYGYGYGGADMAGYGQGLYSYNISYARSQPPLPSSTSLEQLPQGTDATVSYYQHQYPYHGEAVVPSSHYGGLYHSSFYPYPSPVPEASSGHLLAAPPTPSPPRVPTTWGFLDPFDALDSYYQDHPVGPAAHAAASRSSDDVGEEDDDDIPELEDEESGEIVRDDAHAGDECTVVNATFVGAGEDGSGSGEEEEAEGHIEFRSNMVEGVIEGEESVVEVDEQLDDSGVSDAELPAVPETEKTCNEVAQEIRLQFDRASKAAGDLCKMMEVDKVPYCKKKNGSPGLKVPSLMICGQPSRGKVLIMQSEEEKAMESGNPSSSLQKLHIWEKKLLKEVKAMEKIRGLYDNKHKEQKKLYYSGAEAHKLEPLEISVKKLSIKVTIATQIVNNISKNINKLRDEELWPQTHEMVKGFMQMWHTISECHQIQCHVLSHAKDIDSTVAAARFNGDDMDLIKHLEVHLLDLTFNLARWFNAQKSYAIYLNEWLKKGIEYVPKVTDDGVPPFSPGRLGAPPIFSIYNNWAISIGRISEAEVVGAMQALASNILALWERQMAGASSCEALVAEAGLQSRMAKVFEEMERLAASCENAYKDVYLRAEQEE
ncbi:unnamed protein product [Urochloa decumbens]|uniref:Uncharacterized protein n=1 Tax=Urochloa decumbens TaxID=240449 RepID=A0ABC9C3J0_9POAL